MVDVAALTSAAYLVGLPDHVSNSSLLLIPRDGLMSGDIVGIHAKAGLRDITEDIANLLCLQAATILALKQRFPVLRSWFDQIPL